VVRATDDLHLTLNPWRPRSQARPLAEGHRRFLSGTRIRTRRWLELHHARHAGLDPRRRSAQRFDGTQKKTMSGECCPFRQRPCAASDHAARHRSRAVRSRESWLTGSSRLERSGLFWSRTRALPARPRPRRGYSSRHRPARFKSGCVRRPTRAATLLAASSLSRCCKPGSGR
jgi:hypothetical protein